MYDLNTLNGPVGTDNTSEGHDGYEGQEPLSATETQVQHFLTELEQAPAEVQSAVIVRLLAGLATKLPANLPAKVILAAKEGQPNAAKGVGSVKGRSKKPQGEAFARIDSQLALLPDSTDPILAWEHFGSNPQALFNVLRFEPTGALEAMLRHDRMPSGPKPKGRSREALAKAIVERLASYYDMGI
jgi:hypothetical protein